MQQSSLRRQPSMYEPTSESAIPDPSTYNNATSSPGRSRGGNSKQQQQPQFSKKLAKSRPSGSGGGPPTGDMRKSRIGDKIKKRMSMRYADISGPSLRSGNSVPAMPMLPESREQRRPADERVLRDDISIIPARTAASDEASRAADVEALSQQNFDPDAYLKTKLANSTEEEIRSLQSSLNATKAATASDLQRNVYQNYAEFVLISKEISTLENDMLELKESLSEWKSMPSLLNIDDSAASSSVTDRRRTNRSSVADLRTLYANQLTELHMQIEGSSKFVPAIPGRHIVSEFSDLWALNSATYKIEYAVHVVLLDDSMLIAKKRKKRTGGGGKLVAERCWPFGDITMVDVKDSVDLTNVIKIRRGKETHVFRTDTLSDKKSLLTLFRQVSEELATKKRKEREGEHERRRSVWTGDRLSMAGGADPMPSLPSWLADLQAKGLGADKNEEKDARWVGDFVDKLAVAIALREWEESVSLVEQAQIPAGPPTANARLLPRIEPLKSSLIADLLQAISDPTCRKQSIMKLSAFLIRLNAGIAARNAFLETRTDLLRKRARMIRFEGNISLYISELALVTFTVIKHTSEWYLASFREHDMASGMVNWAKEQIESYATMFQKQVYGPDVDSRTIQESIQVTRLQSKRLLQDIGLDFSFLLDTLLAAPPTRPTAPRSKSSVGPVGLAVTVPQPKRTRSPGPLTPGIQTPAGRAPVPLPPRSRERPMSGNVQTVSSIRSKER